MGKIKKLKIRKLEIDELMGILAGLREGGVDFVDIVAKRGKKCEVVDFMVRDEYFGEGKVTDELLNNLV